MVRSLGDTRIEVVADDGKTVQLELSSLPHEHFVDMEDRHFQPKGDIERLLETDRFRLVPPRRPLFG